MIAGRDALSRYLKRTAAAAQQGRLATGNWTRGLVGGWGHSWTPGYGKTKSDVQFVAFHPQLGRFVTNHLELYGEGTLFLYSQPETAVGGGAAAIGGRGVGARMRAGLRASNRRARHLPMRYETGLPSSVIRFRTLHASTASRRCPDELRARRQSPTIDLYRKNAFSTRAC